MPQNFFQQASFPFSRWQSLSLQSIAFSLRLTRINWGICEALALHQTPFILISRPAHLLWGSYLSQKLSIQSYIPGPEGMEHSLLTDNRITAWAQKSSDFEPLHTKVHQNLNGHRNLWVPSSIVGNQEVSLLPDLIEWVDQCQAVLLPVGMSIAKDRSFSLFNDMIFPYPLSRVALCVGNPIQVENVPVDQTYVQIEHALLQAEHLTNQFLEN